MAVTKGNRRHPLALRASDRSIATMKWEYGVKSAPLTDAEVIAATATLMGVDADAFVITPQWLDRRRSNDAIRQQVTANRMSDRAFRPVAIAAYYA